MIWKFKTFVSQNNRAEVQNKINALSDAILIQFLVRIRYLANTRKIDWKKPEAAKLKGVQNVYEIRFNAGGVEYRPLGYFGPGENDFTILIWSFKKQDIYNPTNAIKSASKRRDQITKGEAKCDDLKIDGEYFPPPK